MKIRPVGDELFHAGGRMDGQTDMTKFNVLLTMNHAMILGNCPT